MRILFWDLETSHNMAAIFQLRNNDYVPYQNILQERYIISGAWKWAGERAVHSATSAGSNDRPLVKTLSSVVEQADILVHHNGDRFDLPFLEGRALIHGYKPITRPRTVDTLKIARKRFTLNSNRLDYLGKVLRLGGKAKHDSSLWLRQFVGGREAATALKQMVHYNRQDVRLLEGVFGRLRPYIETPLSKGPKCPLCGKSTMVANATWTKWSCRRCQ